MCSFTVRICWDFRFVRQSYIDSQVQCWLKSPDRNEVCITIIEQTKLALSNTTVFGRQTWEKCSSILQHFEHPLAPFFRFIHFAVFLSVMAWISSCSSWYTLFKNWQNLFHYIRSRAGNSTSLSHFTTLELCSLSKVHFPPFIGFLP